MPVSFVEDIIVACFAASPKFYPAIYNSQLATLDESIVGAPPEVDWNTARNETPHF